MKQIVLEIHQQNHGSLFAEGVRQDGCCRAALDACPALHARQARRAGLERERVIEAHAADAYAVAREKFPWIAGELEREPRAACVKEMAQASAVRIILLQHLEFPLEIHMLLHGGADRGRQARAKLG